MLLPNSLFTEFAILLQYAFELQFPKCDFMVEYKIIVKMFFVPLTFRQQFILSKFISTFDLLLCRLIRSK